MVNTLRLHVRFKVGPKFIFIASKVDTMAQLGAKVANFCQNRYGGLKPRISYFRLEVFRNSQLLEADLDPTLIVGSVLSEMEIISPVLENESFMRGTDDLPLMVARTPAKKRLRSNSEVPESQPATKKLKLQATPRAKAKAAASLSPPSPEFVTPSKPNKTPSEFVTPPKPNKTPSEFVTPSKPNKTPSEFVTPPKPNKVSKSPTPSTPVSSPPATPLKTPLKVPLTPKTRSRTKTPMKSPRVLAKEKFGALPEDDSYSSSED
eukprot:TRINITY_DN1669_c0_g1_i3.p1 TRINITY_DN1669_c0_g1~~TRINITY_DN1669_c0_g1_i3.p1  ORF type:complete len:263 (-),score=64.25 TRINITY_DN1669_c0_g1_i3:862-1650(-)